MLIVPNKYLHNLIELVTSTDSDNDGNNDDNDADRSGITLLDDCGVKCDGDNCDGDDCVGDCDVNDNSIEDVRRVRDFTEAEQTKERKKVCVNEIKIIKN